MANPIEEYDETMESPPAIPAATLVIFRRARAGGAPEILMVERSASMSFAGGAAVFPGGRIDQSDFQLAADLGACDEESLAEHAARIAAVRETLEETGLVVGLHQRADRAQAIRARAMLLDEGALAPVLKAMDWTIQLDGLVPFARWRPKHRHLRIFDTRFYLADLGTGAVDLLVDATENVHLFWTPAAQALSLAAEGRIKLIFPTRRNLERLAQFSSFAEARDHAAAHPVRMITPFVETREGKPWLSIPADSGYPITSEPLESVARE